MHPEESNQNDQAEPNESEGDIHLPLTTEPAPGVMAVTDSEGSPSVTIDLTHLVPESLRESRLSPMQELVMFAEGLVLTVMGLFLAFFFLSQTALLKNTAFIMLLPLTLISIMQAFICFLYIAQSRYSKHLRLSKKDAGFDHFVRVSPKGMLTKHRYMKALEIAWEEITEVTVDEIRSKPFKFRKSQRHDLGVYAAPSRTQPGVPRVIRLPLEQLTSEEREKVFSLLHQYLPHLNIPKPPRIIERKALPKRAFGMIPSYTQIWFSQLSNVLKRQRYVDDLPAETVLCGGQYRVKERLARGGNATVYLAEAIIESGSNKSLVALKEFILPAQDEETLEVARSDFDRECMILKTIIVPEKKQPTWNIVKYVDEFEEDFRCYLVMEYVDGSSLSDLIETSGPMGDLEVIQMGIRMSEILCFLHGLSPPVVHQDFTPDNLILDKNGVLKLVDFNVARKGDETSSLEVAGKVGYMPCEQFRGKPVRESDIYALGATMYFLLTGRHPRSMTALHPASVLPSIGQTLDGIIARATDPEVSNRYHDAYELIADLLILQEDLKQSR